MIRIVPRSDWVFGYAKMRDHSQRDPHFFAQIRYKGRRFKTAGPCGSLILRCPPETTLAGMEIGAVRNTITRLAE